MIDKLGLDGLGGASVRVEPTPQELLGVSEETATPAVVGLEPVHWYLENEDEYMSEKLRKEHERLNSYTFKLCKVAHPLYSADDVAKLQAENEALKAQLAASQAREQQLREALEKTQYLLHPNSIPPFSEISECRKLTAEVLSLPQDDTAMRQWGAKLLREEVERCAADLENTPTPLSVKGLAYEEVCAFIRIVARTIRHSRKADELEKK